MAQKTVGVGVTGNTITAVVTTGSPPPPYNASVATAICTPIKPPGNPINPTTSNFVAPTMTFTFQNLATGVYAVKVDCSSQSFIQTVRVPQQNSFTFSHDQDKPQPELERTA